MMAKAGPPPVLVKEVPVAVIVTVVRSPATVIAEEPVAEKTDEVSVMVEPLELLPNDIWEKLEPSMVRSTPLANTSMA